MNTELIMAILLTIAILLVVFNVLLVRLILSARRNQQNTPLSYKELGAFSSTLQNVHRLSYGLKETVLNIENHLKERRKIDELSQQMIKRIDHIIAGTKTKGLAGENVISEILKQFPPEMIVRNYKIKNKEVEFGLVLSNGKIVPVDSKWTSSDLLDALAKEDDIKQRHQIMNNIQRDIKNRIQEVSYYLDPEVTTSLAICTVPDAAYSVSQNLHQFAYKKNIILVPYSLLLPYILTLYHLHLQYSKDFDIENLQHYLLDIKHNVEELWNILENKLIKSSVMLKNAIDEYRQIISSIRNSLIKITNRKKQKSNIL